MATMTESPMATFIEAVDAEARARGEGHAGELYTRAGSVGTGDWRAGLPWRYSRLILGLRPRTIDA